MQLQTCLILILLFAFPALPDYNPDDNAWRTFGPTPPTDERAIALFTYGDDLYAGGVFNRISSYPVPMLASWDENVWSPVGADAISGPPDGRIQSMTDWQGNLVVGGDFSMIGGQSIGNIAEWNGSTWSPLGPSMSGFAGNRVRAFEHYTGELVVGGDFNTVDGKNANGIARWNGTRWRRFGSGFGSNGICGALAVFDSVLIAGGEFDMAGVASVDNIAKWDSVTGWSRLGTSTMSELNGRVTDLRIFEGDLYACGFFTGTISGIPTLHVARWQPVGLKWEDVGGGVSGDANALWEYGGELFIGGLFDSAGTVAARNVARWNQTEWVPAGTGIPATVEGFAAWNGSLYAATDSDPNAPGFEDAVLRWDGVSWDPIVPLPPPPSGPQNGAIFAAAELGADIVIGGTFTNVGDSALANVARLVGSAWEPMGGGFNNMVRTFASYQGSLVAGGRFTSSGGVSVSRIASWNGSAWAPFGSGINGEVRAAVEHAGDLFVGGEFVAAGGASANRLARWNGSSWSEFGGGADSTVRALASYGTDPIAGGGFATIGGNSIDDLARWDGITWQALGTGLAGGQLGVDALLVVGNDLYVGGDFTTAGGVTVNRIARWDGAGWHALGDGFDGRVVSLAYDDGRLYASGFFSNTGALEVNGAAFWDGAQWYTLGSAFGGTGGAWAIQPGASGDIFFAGGFSKAGGRVSSKLASWSIAIATDVAQATTSASAGRGSLRFLRAAEPNPFRPRTSIVYSLPSRGHTRLTIYDIRGRLVSTLFSGISEAGEQRVTWDGQSGNKSAPPGVYFAVLHSSLGREAIKVIRLH